tara:strand:+ start:64 stop:471 length:408 start_codon:yes stop_codon:yes gene_type:complete
MKIDEWTYKLNLEIPTLYFDNAPYNISLRSIFIECEHANKSPLYWSLRSTAVDKCAINPRQEIAAFIGNQRNFGIKLQGSDYKYVFYEPSIKQEYKLQLTDIHTADFMLTTLHPDIELEIGLVDILFEFTRYARV